MKTLNKGAVLGAVILVLLAAVILYIGLKTSEYRVKVTENSAISIPFGAKDAPAWWEVFKTQYDRPVLNEPAFQLENIDLSFADFDNYDVILTQGRRLNKLVRTKEAKFPFTPLKSGACTAHFDSRYYPDTVFVYYIDKSEKVSFDRKMPPEANSVID